MEQITLDMIPNGYTPTAHISQYDNGRHTRFNLKHITLTGSETVTLKIRKPDGELVSKVIENHTSYVEYVSEKADCDVSGKANSEIVISKDNVVIGSKNFILDIEADPYDGAGVITKTASGRIATFETNLIDVLQSLKCEINAKQDLHGYDHPWVGGAGKNKCATNLFNDGSVGGVSYSIDDNGKITISANSAISVAQRIDIGSMTLPAGTYKLTGIGNIDYLDLRLRTVIDLGSTEFAVCNKNNPSVSFTLRETTTFYAVFIVLPNFVGTTVCEQMIRLASETSSEYEPYSNICPIVGHSELNLTRCGKNLFDNSNFPSGHGSIVATYNADGTVTLNGTASGNEYFSIPIDLPNSNYVLSVGNTSANANVHVSFVKHNSEFYGDNDLSTTSKVVNISGDISAIVFYVLSGTTLTDFTIKPMLELGSTASEYEPYNGDTFTVQFGQTVYGGVYDKSGRLTITHGYILVDENTPTLQYNGSTSESVKAYFDCTDKANGNLNIISDRFETSIDNEVGNVRGRENTNGVEFLLPLTVTPTTAGVKQWFADNNTQLAYELATPIVIDVPSISVFAENGTNNVFSDTGDTEVKYLYKEANE